MPSCHASHTPASEGGTGGSPDPSARFRAADAGVPLQCECSCWSPEQTHELGASVAECAAGPSMVLEAPADQLLLEGSDFLPLLEMPRVLRPACEPAVTAVRMCSAPNPAPRDSGVTVRSVGFDSAPAGDGVPTKGIIYVPSSLSREVSPSLTGGGGGDQTSTIRGSVAVGKTVKDENLPSEVWAKLAEKAGTGWRCRRWARYPRQSPVTDIERERAGEVTDSREEELRQLQQELLEQERELRELRGTLAKDSSGLSGGDTGCIDGAGGAGVSDPFTKIHEGLSLASSVLATLSGQLTDNPQAPAPPPKTRQGVRPSQSRPEGTASGATSKSPCRAARAASAIPLAPQMAASPRGAITPRSAGFSTCNSLIAPGVAASPRLVVERPGRGVSASPPRGRAVPRTRPTQPRKVVPTAAQAALRSRTVRAG